MLNTIMQKSLNELDMQFIFTWLHVCCPFFWTLLSVPVISLSRSLLHSFYDWFKSHLPTNPSLTFFSKQISYAYFYHNSYHMYYNLYTFIYGFSIPLRTLWMEDSSLIFLFVSSRRLFQQSYCLIHVWWINKWMTGSRVLHVHGKILFFLIFSKTKCYYFNL